MYAVSWTQAISVDLQVYNQARYSRLHLTLQSQVAHPGPLGDVVSQAHTLE